MDFESGQNSLTNYQEKLTRALNAKGIQVPSFKKLREKVSPVTMVNTVNKIRSGVSKLNQRMQPAPVALLELATGAWVSQAISVAARLNVADHIGHSSMESDELAKLCSCQPQSLYRLLRALTVVGVLTEEEGRKFRLTTIGHCLREDHPRSMKYMITHIGRVGWPAWGDLEHSVRTGQNAIEHLYGMKPFEHLNSTPENAEIFNKAMTNVSKIELDTILGAYDFSGFKVLADIGAGHGALLASILRATPDLHGILFDLKNVVAGAKTDLSLSSVEERIAFHEGSFFDEIPTGADAYIMKHIIHDWSDDEAVAILANIRKVIPATGRLLLVETVIPARNEAHFSKILDLEMLVLTTGRERTGEEFAALFRRAGFELARIVPTMSMACVIEAKPSERH